MEDKSCSPPTMFRLKTEESLGGGFWRRVAINQLLFVVRVYCKLECEVFFPVPEKPRNRSSDCYWAILWQMSRQGNLDCNI